ncbi:MAG: 50S ribosomal protein L13 [Clostridia bacterium]|nr:50S ribosomal protein L13 [Clostridia bacterium]
MSTSYMAKANEVERKWYIIDADGKPLGRVAAQAASILRGKHRPEFTPHVDCGEFVIIINAGKAVLTGKKLDQKKYYRHTGYVGGLKEVKYSKLMKEKPEFAMMKAVKGMLPHNTLGAKSLTRLRVYAGAEHDNAAQKPEAWTLEIK